MFSEHDILGNEYLIKNMCVIIKLVKVIQKCVNASNSLNVVNITELSMKITY